MELSPEELAGFFDTVLPHLNELQTRVVAGAMAEALGRGGQARVVEASGMSSSTIYKSVAEVRAGVEPSDRQRAVGGGDKPAIDKQPGLLEALDELVHPSTRGTPMSALRWTLKSTYELAADLQSPGVSGLGGAGAQVAAPDGLQPPGAGQAERGHVAPRP